MIMAVIVVMAMCVVMLMLMCVIMIGRIAFAGADALDMVVMAFLREPHFGFEAQDLFTVRSEERR